jgi:hypothetical protein
MRGNLIHLDVTFLCKQVVLQLLTSNDLLLLQLGW